MDRLVDCTCTAKIDSKDEFVGIRYESGSAKIYFPAGYFRHDNEIGNLSEDALREKILNLFSVLGDSSLSAENDHSSVSRVSDLLSEVRFPMTAYLNVLRNYLDHGYYTEKEVLFKRGTRGKISWSRTIKTTRPIVSEDEKSFLYLNPVARHTSQSESELITQIHKFCVHDASRRIGFIFGIDVQENPNLDFDCELFRSVLQSRISRTFNEGHLRLFGDLQRIVEYIANKLTTDSSNADDFYFGVNKFAPVWEAMLDRIFGNLGPNESKAEFNPHSFWQLENELSKDADRHSLRPDTIMRQDDNSDIAEIFVLDAKFYSHGITSEGSLPDSSSITKQIAYAEYIETKDGGKGFGVDGLHVYNAFLLPYAAKGSDSSKPYQMKFFGSAHGNWKSIEASESAYRPYHRIAGIFLDVESVMKNYRPSRKAQRELADLIRRNLA